MGMIVQNKERIITRGIDKGLFHAKAQRKQSCKG
jgi:hypothetical protein